MKKITFLTIIGTVLIWTLFFGCSLYEPPEAAKNEIAQTGCLTDLEWKEELALKHLIIPNADEDTLASYVMSFLKAGDALGTARSVQPASQVTISKTTKLIYPVETGFYETAEDQRSAQSAAGPGELPFYVFTLEDQNTGETGFALTCGDNRIGNVLAVVEEGNYDDDCPFLNIFYAHLGAYIEETIAAYNQITQADIDDALNKRNEARATGPDLPVSIVGKSPGDFANIAGEYLDIPVRWKQGDPYNGIVNKIRLPQDTVYQTYYTYITGCGPVAIAQIMAYYRVPRRNAKVTSFTDVEYNWEKMIDGYYENGSFKYDNDAIGVLMYEIGLSGNAKAIYKMGYKDENYDPLNIKMSASTSTESDKYARTFANMGYKDPGSIKAYKYSGVKSSIDAGKPVLAWGYGESGHAWVIAGYRYMETEYKNKVTGLSEFYPANYVHCNMGWGANRCNGWYIDAVFDAREYKDGNGNTYTNIPLETRSAVKYYYKYGLQMLTNITPK